MQDDVRGQVQAWRSQLRKGTLELAVLQLLRKERRYGLQLVDVLNEHGIGVSEGSIYPLLSRLRAEKKVETEWVDDGVGHAHKYYRLTPHGEATCAAMLKAWREFNRAFERVTGEKA
jgi:PadR family transcriptional regulator, regulatory protein PadR